MNRSARVLARPAAVGLLTSLVTAVGVAAPPTAVAACQQPYVEYRVWLIRDFHRPFPDLPRFKDGRGGVIEGSVDRTDSQSASVGVATSAEVDGVFAAAKVEVNASITRSTSATIGHKYSHRIPGDRYGHLAYGSWAKRVGWKKIWHTADCNRKVLKKGKMTFPTNSVGWRFWTTRT